MDDVGFLKLLHTGDVGAAVGHVDLEEVASLEVEMKEEAPALPEEMPLQQPLVGQGRHGDVVGLLVCHQHHGLDAAVVERVLESVGGNCRTARALACVYDQNSHCREYCILFVERCKLTQKYWIIHPFFVEKYGEGCQTFIRIVQWRYIASPSG